MRVPDEPFVRLQLATTESIEAARLSSLILDLQTISELAMPVYFTAALQGETPSGKGQPLPPGAVGFTSISFASPLTVVYKFLGVTTEVARIMVQNSENIFKRLIIPEHMASRAHLENDLLRQEIMKRQIEYSARALKVYKEVARFV
jgi:hypothetical protein